MHLNFETLYRLSKVYGDAFYLLDSEAFRNNYIELKEAFAEIYPNFNIAYSYKTNYTPKLCRIVNDLGGYAEVVSDMEMEIALRIGVDPKRIIWNGPVKKREKVEQLLLTGGTVNIDSLYELEMIRAISEAYPNHVLNIGLRCNFDVGDGVISRFGLDINGNDFEKAVRYILENPDNIHLINLHCHFAKRQAKYWPSRVAGMLDVVDRVSALLGYLPERIDLGGGMFGKMPESLKAQFSSEIPEYKAYAQAAAIQFAKHFKKESSLPELLIEPGSAVAGDSMKFVARVVGVKHVRGKDFATLLGSQKNISMPGINPPIEIYSEKEAASMYEDLDMVGYTCIESDVLFKHFSGQLAAGDFVVFHNCGSYSIVMKPPFIMENFPILDICESDMHPEVIKRGECFDDLFHTFNF